MAEENKNGEKKGQAGLFATLADKLKLGGLFGGRPWALPVISLVLVILIILLIAVATSGKGKSREVRLVTPGVLTAAVVFGDDRYAYHDDTGKLAGTEPSIAAALAETEGLELKLIETSTVNEALTMLDTGAADVAFGRISSERNLTGYAVSDEYSRCGLFLVTMLHDYTDSLALMTGYSVGVMDTVQVTAEKTDNYSFITPRTYTDAIALGEDIRDRAINMGIFSERDAISLVRSFPNALQMQEIAGGPKEHYVAVFSGRQAAQATLLNAVLSGME